jgi:hypothetical protein
MEKEKLIKKVEELNLKAPSNKIYKFVEASYCDGENSNLYQVAEVIANRMRSSEEWWIFVGFIYISPKPFKYGIAEYEKI